jgi:Domain of unknown function (DUF4333)
MRRGTLSDGSSVRSVVPDWDTPGTGPVPQVGSLRVPIRCFAVVLLLAVALVSAGCGETQIDDVKMEDTIQQYLEKDLNEDVKSIDCPSGEPVEANNRFDCAVILDGGKKMIATVKIRDKDANFGIVDYRPMKQERGE